MSGFTNCEVVNTIIILRACCIWFSAFTLVVFSQFFSFSFLGIGAPCSMMLDSLTLLSNSTVLLRFVFPTDHASLYLCGCCAAYLLEYSFITLHSSECFPGPCSKIFLSAPVVLSFRETSFFVLRLPARPFLGLVVEAAYTHFVFMTWLSRFSSDLRIFYKVFVFCKPVQRFPFSRTLHRFP